MPDMANISVLKNDGTTSVVYTKVQASAGDRSPAVWRNLTVGTAAGHRPEVRLTARANGNGTARRIDGVGVYPTLVVDGTGKTQVADKLVVNVSVSNPLGMPDSDVNEGVSQILNLFASTLVKDSCKTGYAPT
jgi:hypothetical protein